MVEIIEYAPNYTEKVKELLVELQEYIQAIDKEGYNILSEYYSEKYFEKTMKEINECNGKMYLSKENNKITGLIVGLINNEETSEYDFKAPKEEE